MAIMLLPKPTKSAFSVIDALTFIFSFSNLNHLQKDNKQLLA